MIKAEQMLEILKQRFLEQTHRHQDIGWEELEAHLKNHPDSLKKLAAMEASGGEPDVLSRSGDEFLFCDFCKVLPAERMSLCYDEAAWHKRKANKPRSSVEAALAEMGTKLMTEEIYGQLQAVEAVDEKNSTWLSAPEEVRSLGGGLFGDRRYGRVFIYHNGAESYYASRGFRSYFIG